MQRRDGGAGWKKRRTPDGQVSERTDRLRRGYLNIAGTRRKRRCLLRSLFDRKQILAPRLHLYFDIGLVIAEHRNMRVAPGGSRPDRIKRCNQGKGQYRHCGERPANSQELEFEQRTRHFTASSLAARLAAQRAKRKLATAQKSRMPA